METSGRMGARRIYETLKAQIIGRTYGTDGALPSSRSLAAELGVSRSTITVAYEQLAAEGFINVRHGARPRVVGAAVGAIEKREASRTSARNIHLSQLGARLLKDASRWTDPPRGLVANFRYGELSPSDFPASAWKKAMVAAISRKPVHLAYDDPCGSLRLRRALQGYLWRSRSVRCHVDQIVVVNGSQQGLDICSRLLLDAGDRFVMEDPGYQIAKVVFAATGAIAVPVPVDADGLDTKRVAKIEARLAYVTPSHQYPLGGVLPVARRYELLAWARKHDAWLIEDDYDSEYRYDTKPVPPLQTLQDSGRVVYLGTVSKTLSPTLRVGYLVVPAGLQSAFAAAKQVMDRHTPLLEQEALAAMLESGTYEGHVRRARRRNAERRESLLQALHRRFGDRVRVEGAAAGLHLVAWFEGLPIAAEDDLVRTARSKGVGVYPISPLFDQRTAGRPDVVGLVMGYSALDAKQIEKGCKLLADAVEQIDRLANWTR